MMGREDDEGAARWLQDVRAALRARALLEEDELAAVEVDSRLRQDGQDLEREEDVAVEVLMEGVPVALAVAEDERRRPRLAGGGALLEQLLVRERERRAVAAQQRRPVVRDRREVAVEALAQLGDRRGQRMVEVAIAPVAEAMAGHVDRRAEAAAVELRGEVVALGGCQ